MKNTWLLNKNTFEIYTWDCLKVLDDIDKKYTCIYMDPPFNSNRNYKYSALDEDDKFEDKWKWNEYEYFIDTLIKKSKSKLTKDWSLFFHISSEESYIPHTILKKYFSKVEVIYWKKSHGKNTVKNKLWAVVDIIFKASSGKEKFNLLHTPLDSYYFENSYKNKDDVWLYALGAIKHDKTRKWHMYSLEIDWIVYETDYWWRVKKEKMIEMIEQKKIHFTKPKKWTNKGMLYKKLYKHECKWKPLSNLWDDISYITRTTKDKRYYPTQKPLQLLERIIELSTDEDDWILDPVAWSWTTWIAWLKKKRNITLIDLNEETLEIFKERKSQL